MTAHHYDSWFRHSSHKHCKNKNQWYTGTLHARLVNRMHACTYTHIHYNIMYGAMRALCTKVAWLATKEYHDVREPDGMKDV